MKKILLLYKVFADDEATKGIYRKMLEQGRSLERLGAKVDMVSLHSKGIQCDGKLVVMKSLFNKSARNQFMLFGYYRDLKKLDKLEQYDVFYIRYSPLTFGMIGFLKHLKALNPNCKIYIDLATYPFLGEYQGFKKLLAQLISFRHKYLKKYVTKIVSVGNEKTIWGIPVVNIKNAIDTESYKLRNAVDVPGVIRLVMVSTFWNWHGIDRMLNGIANYIKQEDPKYKIYFTLIGEGPELSKSVELSEQLGLKDQVFFFPPAYGSELNQYFDQADIAVGTLAVDRINLTDCSALKHREYGARGIPFIYAGSDTSFDGQDFVLQLPLKEEAIDFKQVVSFYEKIKNFSANYAPDAVKSRVKSDLSWESQLGFLLQ